MRVQYRCSRWFCRFATYDRATAHEHMFSRGIVHWVWPHDTDLTEDEILERDLRQIDNEVNRRRD